MSMALLILHVFLSLGIITLVLLQKGAGASAGAAFGGGGGAGSVFGASGSANFLSKMTAILATGFFLNSLALAYVAAHRDVTVNSVLDSLSAPTTEIIAPSAPAEETDIVPAAEGALEQGSAVDDSTLNDVPPPADDATIEESSDIHPADEAVKE